MEITVNSETRAVDDGVNVAAILGDDVAGVAVAVNGKFVKKEERESTVLKNGDNVIIIKAAYGG